MMTHVSARSATKPMELSQICRSIGTDGIDHLMTLLTYVKSRGWDDAFSEDVRYGQDSSGNPNSYSEPLLSLRQSLEDSKLCLEALKEVKCRLGKKIRHLQRRAIPLVLEDGIKRLPNELLAHIFEAGFQMTEDSEFSVRVSHVSRRFRDISLRTPRLWTRLSTDFGLAQIHAFLCRSTYFDIHVEIAGSPRSVVESFVRMLAPHSGRWSRLTHRGDETESSWIFQDLDLFDFPRLRYICHYFWMDISALNLPMLSHIAVENVCDPLDLPIPSQLTCVDLLLRDFDLHDIAELAQMLYQVTGLQDLSLDVVNCQLMEGWIVKDVDVVEIPDTHTCPIEFLSITIRGSTTRDFATALYDALGYLTSSRVDIFLPADHTVQSAHEFIFSLTPGLFPTSLGTVILHNPLGSTYQHSRTLKIPLIFKI
ncbi:hypothetical protein BD410DRAFT_876856 [Rickenella mellea]|uniref:F-box domain-containing protein n=1 Tax=Rickenella mellea TaxID=50990 RepID=A0A4Y7PVV3_9AGAM|nr:hypothetical protein BD410DRAFT_876856 [Rickenella mellea]